MQAPDFDPVSVLGQRVQVFWPIDKEWYSGRFVYFNEQLGKHVVRYDEDQLQEPIVLRVELRKGRLKLLQGLTAAPEARKRPPGRPKKEVFGDADRRNCQQLLDVLTQIQDGGKGKRQVAELFVKLPERKELPRYYRLIKEPMDVERILGRLERQEYTDAATFRSDAELMFSNALLFNERSSQVAKDAVQLKALFGSLYVELMANKPVAATNLEPASPTGGQAQQPGDMGAAAAAVGRTAEASPAEGVKDQASAGHHFTKLKVKLRPLPISAATSTSAGATATLGKGQPQTMAVDDTQSDPIAGKKRVADLASSPTGAKKSRAAYQADPPTPSATHGASGATGKVLVGRSLRLFWPMDKVWYEGEVVSFDHASGTYMVRYYADGLEETVDVHKEEREGHLEWKTGTPGRPHPPAPETHKPREQEDAARPGTGTGRSRGSKKVPAASEPEAPVLDALGAEDMETETPAPEAPAQEASADQSAGGTEAGGQGTGASAGDTGLTEEERRRCINMLDMVRDYLDSDDRRLSMPFVRLPERDELPDYYRHVLQPMDFVTLYTRLSKKEYATGSVAAFLADGQRMFTNAHRYNAEHSQVYEDATVLLQLFCTKAAQAFPAYADQLCATDRAHSVAAEAPDLRSAGGAAGKAGDLRSMGDATGKAGDLPLEEVEKTDRKKKRRRQGEEKALEAALVARDAQAESAASKHDAAAAVQAQGTGSKGEGDCNGVGGQSAASSGWSLVGRCLKVYWPLDHKWYRGRVLWWDGPSGKHQVRYEEDGDVEMLDLSQEQVVWDTETKSGAKGEPRIGRPPKKSTLAQRRDPIELASPASSSQGGLDDDARDWCKAVLDMLWQAENSRNVRMASPFEALPGRQVMPEYYKVILQPMDLVTISIQLGTGRYSDTKQFVADLERVFSNAQRYNHDASEIYQYSLELQKLLQQQVAQKSKQDEARRVGGAGTAAERTRSGVGGTSTPCSTPTRPSQQEEGSLVGRRVRIYWPTEKEWFSGRVMKCNKVTGEHQVKYDDGDKEWLDLEAEKVQWLGDGLQSPSVVSKSGKSDSKKKR
ncbi:hypothetical protein CYMTET_28796 [Cymbomonas tetramitiformis]|uniref:Bromo domain-containing protein n=1 Tax=Cymbomonas tetramitiformis TaxID=36881 RepID=A0AAE0FM94_9CHLO|nr:hypothetical protein CYMTET_28796 [Cymbomonas tetramitiformis]